MDRSQAGGDFRDQNLRWKYDITLAEREALFAEQGDLCAICEEAEPNDIDYDHSHHCADPLRAEDEKRGCRDCVRGGLCQALQHHPGCLRGWERPWWRGRAAR